MRFLCVCALGNSRSVACAYLLKLAGHEALAVGAEATSPETLAYLAAWADKIIVIDRRFRDRIPENKAEGSKVLEWYLDGDPYFKGFDLDLLGFFFGKMGKDDRARIGARAGDAIFGRT